MNEGSRIVSTFADVLSHGTQRLMEWKVAVADMLPNLLAAFCVVVLFSTVARLFRPLAQKIFRRFTRNDLVVLFLGRLTSFTITILGIVFALGILRLDRTVTSILAGAGLFGLAISFAFQDIVANFISGLFITFYKPFEVGDDIKTKEFSGHVVYINLRNTVIDSNDGDRVLIPNKDIVQNALTNNSVSGSRRVTLQIEVEPSMSFGEIQKVAGDVASTVEQLDSQRRVECSLSGYTDEKFRVKLGFWVRSIGDRRAAEELRTKVLLQIIASLRTRNVKVLPT